MNTQRLQDGVALSGLLVWGIIIAVVAMFGMKIAPDLIDFYKIRKDVKATAQQSAGKTVPEIRAIFGKYLDVDHVKSITPADIDITKQGNEVVISFAYERRIPLFANVSLLIDFEGSSAGNN